MEKKANPKQILLVLLVVTIIVSSVGTWLMLEAITQMAPAEPAPSDSLGNVQIKIATLEEMEQHPSDSETGKVSIFVEKQA